VKLKAGQVEAFLARPDPAMATVLLHGPDSGLVTARARKLASTVVEDPADPFRVSELDADKLRFEPHLLVEEAQALCFLGGRRLVRVRRATDGMSGAVQGLLALADQAALVILEAGDLGPASSLRQLVERAKRAMALPCYHDEDKDLRAIVQGALAADRLTAEPAALEYLLESLGGDRGVTASELAKLALLVADRPDRRIGLADAAAAVGDSAALAIEDAVRAAAVGDGATAEQALLRLLAEGVAPVRVIRAASSFLLLLLRLRRAADKGGGLDAAIAAARPPIFFRARDAAKAALQRWRAPELLAALARLQEAELACKRTGMPAPLVCRRALAQLAATASAAAARARA
jgi:DNA polymerase-3 subunit delta